MYAATRLFASNLNVTMAQRFFNLVLLPRVRQDIADNRRLHFALFMAAQEGDLQARGIFQGYVVAFVPEQNVLAARGGHF